MSVNKELNDFSTTFRSLNLEYQKLKNDIANAGIVLLSQHETVKKAVLNVAPSRAEVAEIVTPEIKL